MNDMSEWKHDIRSLVRRFEQAVNSGYMMNMDDEEIIDLFDYYFEIQDIQKAEMVIDQWGRLFPMDDMRKLCLAKLLTYKEEYSEALSTLDEVMYLDDFEVYLYRGYALLGLHRVDEAVEMFNKALELADEADEYRLRYEISVALERNKYGDLAMSFLDKANGLDTKDLVLLNDLISFSFRNGKYEDCISYCNKALDIDPYQKEAWVYQGFAYDSLGNKEKAGGAGLRRGNIRGGGHCLHKSRTAAGDEPHRRGQDLADAEPRKLRRQTAAAQAPRRVLREGAGLRADVQDIFRDSDHGGRRER